MARSKFVVGETVEMFCYHVRDNQRVQDWLTGRVIQTDQRMIAVQFEQAVFSNNGWLIPDQILWCAHGSPHIRRKTTELAEHL